ncbi:MAG: TlpA disulfide reductase family protein [Gemmatimonadetes bacterium]|nr:TlpA disulfide reductase family protein [Gemmatimonadota bacterium]
MLVVVAGIAVLSCADRAQAQEEIGISRGSTPDPVALENLDGETVDLADYFGKRPVLLEFWATWCENCEALQPQMDAAYEQFGDRMDFFAVAVGVGQSPRTIRRHLRRHPVPYPLLFDKSGAAVRAFMTPATSYVVILDADGKVAYTGIGAQQDVGVAIERVLEMAGQ